jgi:hypothetical protein
MKGKKGRTLSSCLFKCMAGWAGEEAIWGLNKILVVNTDFDCGWIGSDGQHQNPIDEWWISLPTLVTKHGAGPSIGQSISTYIYI